MVERFTFANNAALTSATGFFAQDVGKLAYQQDNQIYWRLTNWNPPTWELVTYSTNMTSDPGNGVMKNIVSDAVTAATTDAHIISHKTSGTPAAGFGTSLLFNAQDATVADQSMARIGAVWNVVTDATRASYIDFQTITGGGALTSAARIWGSNGISLCGSTTDPGAGILSGPSFINAATGYRLGGTAATGNYLRGNGTNFVNSALLASDLKGTTTNDNATAGNIGEYVESWVDLGSGPALTSGTITNITSISLTAGDWQMGGYVGLVGVSGTAYTFFYGGYDTANNTLNVDAQIFQNIVASTTINANSIMYAVPTRRMSLAATTTIYLNTQAIFSGGTANGHGAINARRMR